MTKSIFHIHSLISITILFSLVSFVFADVHTNTNADNFYLEQIKQAKVKTPNSKLHDRIKKFPGKKRYKIKNLPSFHKQKEKKQAAETLCQICHGRLPHTQNSNVRAFLNLHSQRIDCLTCHYQSDQSEKKALNFIWDKTETSKKIVPMRGNQSLLISATHPFALQTKKRWDSADIYQKARLYQQIHQPLSKKKVACSDCHQHNGLLDLAALKFKPEEIHKIETNRISHFVSGLKTEANTGSDKQPGLLLRGLLQ